MKSVTFTFSKEEFHALLSCLQQIHDEKPWDTISDKNIGIIVESVFVQLLIRVEKRSVILSDKNRITLSVAEAAAMRTLLNLASVHLDAFGFSVIQHVLNRIDQVVV